MPGSTSIYALVDPISWDVKYIGKTSSSPERRLTKHLYDARHPRRGCHFAAHKWLAGILKYGMTPEIMVMEVVRNEDWRAAEQSWIDRARAVYGARLLNRHPSAGADMTDEWRQNISAAFKKKYRDPDERAKRSAAVRAYYQTPEGKAKRSAVSKKSWAGTANHEKRVWAMQKHRYEAAT